MNLQVYWRAVMAGPIVILCMAAAAHADVTISSGTTQNMSCTAGACVPTSDTAVLNTGDLQTMLAAGSVSISTTNTGVQANNIDVAAPFSWKTASALTLDAYDSITVTGAVSDAGAGGVTLVTNDGGSGGNLSFLNGGSIGFTNLEDMLVINGTAYKLAASIKELAAQIVAHPDHAFALANDINARPHGIYRTSPIPVIFAGSFTGLGHVISNVEIGDFGDDSVGFFAAISAPANIGGIGLENIRINSGIGASGGLAGGSTGTISNAWASGRILGEYACGGLIGENGGIISNSWSSANVECGEGAEVGGLVGMNTRVIETSFATGTVTTNEGEYSGGLAGYTYTTIEDSYSSGPVRGTAVGGLAGGAGGTGGEQAVFKSDYSTGRAERRGASTAGGFVGYNLSMSATSCYWDTSTNNKATTGLGNGNIAGLVGLTSAKFKSGLPKGFDPTIWAEDPSINNGFPYLIANPPP